MAITLADVTGTGTYALEDGFPLRFAVVTLGSAQGWGTTDGGGGTLTISSFTSQRIQATFSFTAVPAPNSSQSVNLSVTNGQFDLPVTIVQ